MTEYVRLTVAFAACLGILVGCGSRDPYQRDDVWYPTGANAANLAAQVANPNDLVRGQSDPKQQAGGPARSVNRVWTDSAKSLTPSASGGSSGGGSGGGSAGGGSAGGDTPSIPGLTGGG